MKVVFLDTETTGTDKTTDEIIELAIIQYDTYTKEINKLYHNKFLPSVAITEEALAIHEITLESLKDCIKFTIDAPLIQSLISNKIIGGHNVSFDITILNRQLVESNEKGIPINTDTVDTFLIEKVVNSHKLSETYLRYTKSELTNAHSAYDDTIASIKILENQLAVHNLTIEEALTSKVKSKLGGSNVNWLDYGHCFYLENDEIKFGFGKHKTESVLIYPGYLKWMLANQFGYDTKEICKYILKKIKGD